MMGTRRLSTLSYSRSIPLLSTNVRGISPAVGALFRQLHVLTPSRPFYSKGGQNEAGQPSGAPKPNTALKPIEPNAVDERRDRNQDFFLGRAVGPSKGPMGDLDVLGDEEALQHTIRVTSYIENGFAINDIYHQGSVMLFPDLAVLWSPEKWGDITLDSLTLVDVFNPRLDILIIGCGSHAEMIPPPIREHFRKKGTVIEAMDTPNACSTFNILNQEERQVGAALLALPGAIN